MIRLGCAQLNKVALFSCAKAHGHGHWHSISSTIFTYKIRTMTVSLYDNVVGPKLTAGWRSTRAKAITTTTGRLKREDFRHTHFDSAFSQWKILSGPSDWENYLMGKEGEERYRTQNLPNITCFPAELYEIGILTSTSLMVVYVGQSQNLRARLQQYGRNGAHLESPARLFSDVFSKGHTIVYRCAPMKSKRDAEETEDEILGKFDYAWNKRCNGDRRPGDIHKKLLEYSRFSLVNMIRQYFHDQIKTRDPFMISKNKNKSATIICGVATATGYGSSSNICAKPPVPGRKRCADHKGMKVDGAPDHIINAGRHNQKSNKSIVTRKRYASEHPIKYEKFCSYLWSTYIGRWFT